MGKNNEKIWKIGRILVPIILALVLAVLAYGRLLQRVDAVEAKVEKAEDTRERVIRMEADIGHIKGVVDDIKKDLKDARR